MLADRTAPAAVALALLLSSCGPRADHGAHATAEAAPPVRVAVVSPTSADPAALVLPGRVHAREEAVVAARTAGRVSAFAVREGESVAAGQVVVRFDAPEARRTLLAARSGERSAALALEVAARQHARMESLHTAQVVSAAEREQAESAHRAAEARLADAAAQREQAEAALVVRAPFAGVVVRRHLDPGTDVVPGTPLLEVRSAGAPEVVAAVPERAAHGIAALRAEAQLEDGAWEPVRLLRVDGMVDPASRTRTARFAAPAAWPPGAFARLRLRGTGDAAAATLQVPVASVVRRGALTGVFLVEDGHARLRWLRLGAREGGQVAVLAGLAPEARVVRDPAGLTDGAAVEMDS